MYAENVRSNVSIGNVQILACWFIRLHTIDMSNFLIGKQNMQREIERNRRWRRTRQTKHNNIMKMNKNEQKYFHFPTHTHTHTKLTTVQHDARWIERKSELCTLSLPLSWSHAITATKSAWLHACKKECHTLVNVPSELKAFAKSFYLTIHFFSTAANAISVHIQKNRKEEMMMRINTHTHTSALICQA